VETDKAVIYCEREGFRALELDLHRPDHANGRLPLLLYVHGGGFRLSHRSRAPRETRGWDPGFFELLTAAGFAVAANDYRFSDEALYPAPVDDTKEALRWLRTHADELGVDAARVVLFGASAGGLLAATVGLAVDVGPIAGVVCWYPITDLRTVDQQTPDSFEAHLVGGPIGERPELAEAASATTHVRPGAPPFHLVHGSADTMVACDQSLRLKAALEAVGGQVSLEVIEGAGHFFEGAADEVRPVFERSLSFLRSSAGF
jgi:acetyl esterase/lipase